MSNFLKKDKSSRKIKRNIIGFFVFVIVVLIVLFYVIITQSGHWLVQDDKFTHVKWVAILDGQTAQLERNDFTAQLLKDHKVDSVLILGRRVFRDKSNAEFYAEDFMRLGDFDSNAVFLAKHDDPSTIGEAHTIIPWFKARNADSVLLITYSPATKRAAKIFNRLSGNKPRFLTIDMHPYIFNADSWYANREERKIWLREWAATLACVFDLFKKDTLSASDTNSLYPIKSFAEEYATDVIDLQKMIPALEEKIDSIQTITPIDSTTSRDVEI